MVPPCKWLATSPRCTWPNVSWDWLQLPATLYGLKDNCKEIFSAFVLICNLHLCGTNLWNLVCTGHEHSSSVFIHIIYLSFSCPNCIHYANVADMNITHGNSTHGEQTQSTGELTVSWSLFILAASSTTRTSCDALVSVLTSCRVSSCWNWWPEGTWRAS